MAQQVLTDALKKGEEIFQTVSGRLLEQPVVAKAFEAAMVGKSKVDEGVAKALKRMNVQTRSEFKSLRSRVDGLEVQVSELRKALDALKAARATKASPKGPARKAAKKA